MRQREALFNEIKGSLFEYLVAREIAARHGLEAGFLKALPPQYQSVLEQQDRMTREAYPELLPLLPAWAEQAADAWQARFPAEPLVAVELTGQFNAGNPEWRETDFLLRFASREVPVSLKLNKRQSAVNTKSGGAKSFLTTYFPGDAAAAVQAEYTRLVDAEFLRVHQELHRAAGLDLEDGWGAWVRAGYSELPGELPDDWRELLHAYYGRLARGLRAGLEQVARAQPDAFHEGLKRLVGHGLPHMVQLVCFHDHGGRDEGRVKALVHTGADVEAKLLHVQWLPPRDVASFVLQLADWELHVRIKPMNKFTASAPKINCAVKFPS